MGKFQIVCVCVLRTAFIFRTCLQMLMKYVLERAKWIILFSRTKIDPPVEHADQH